MRRTYSYSKRDALESRVRRYFYEYYAAAKAVPFDAERKEAIRWMKGLKNRHLVAGEILHSLIQMRLTRGLGWSTDWLVCLAGKRFDGGHLFSQPVRRPSRTVPPATSQRVRVRRGGR